MNESRKFLSKYLVVVPKLLPRISELSNLKYPSQLVTVVLILIIRNNKKSTQQKEHDSELERAHYAQNEKFGLEKYTRDSVKFVQTPR